VVRPLPTSVNSTSKTAQQPECHPEGTRRFVYFHYVACYACFVVKLEVYYCAAFD
jgi:hypothetical protein